MFEVGRGVSDRGAGQFMEQPALWPDRQATVTITHLSSLQYLFLKKKNIVKIGKQFHAEKKH